MKVLVYPKDPNPYQTLLYSKFNKSITVTYLKNPTKSHTLGLLLLPAQLISFRFQGYRIFHLHWVYMFKLIIYIPFIPPYIFKMLFTLYFIFIIIYIKFLGFKLVWTIHDLVPHEEHFVNDRLISRFLSKLSDAKIVHSSFTILTMKQLGFDITNTEIIPIGNYIDVYPNIISQQKAKASLNINHDDFVFGFFGRIEKYKGIYELVDNFNKLHLKNTKLLIAGVCIDENIRRYLKKEAKLNSNILLNLSHIPDDKVQIYINSADIFVYPFTRVTTSSSVILVMSFKKPVIATRVGDICDFPNNTGYYYSDLKKEKSLTNFMKLTAKNKNRTLIIGKNAYNYIKSINWYENSVLTIEIYKNLLLIK